MADHFWNVHEVKFGPPPVDSDIVRMLEQWLERARAGQLEGIAIAGANVDGGVAHEWYGAGPARFRLIGAVALLQSRITAGCSCD